jgi:hypothetical protein
MSSDANNPLLSKADSLLNRLGSDPLGKQDPVAATASAIATAPADADIPMLDEILTPAATKSPHGAVIDDHTRQLIIKTALSQLVPMVEEKLTRELQQQLLNHLNSAASAAVTVAIADLKIELSNAVGDAVNRAVTEVLKK